MSERIGFFICHCGINIAYRVRVKEVVEYAATFPGVVVARDYLFMCSDPGQDLIEKEIRNHDLTRVVVAACSPRMHEKTFRAACQRAGLNPYRAFHMVTVREHGSWVTETEDAATAKAIVIARAGLMRVTQQNELFPSRFSVNPNTLVVGGGIAGMQAALDIASSGNKVYLVERQPTVGGHMLQYDKTFPTLDCAACIGTPKMVAVGQDRNIQLMTSTEVESVSGFVGNFKVTVNQHSRYVKPNCTGCGDCAKVCPIDAPNEWDVRTKVRKSIYISFPQAVPVRYAIDKKDRAPCVQTCPAGINIQGFVALIKVGKYRESLELILEKMPLPGSLGRVCPAPCEGRCRREVVDSPLAISKLKRFASDQVDWSTLDVPTIEWKPETEKVAIIGAGPAGLSAAYFLARSGYHATILEAAPLAGGVLRYGIPDYRLPPAVLDQEIEYIQRLGVDIQVKTSVGTDRPVGGLFDEGFKAVFLAAGAPRSVKLNIPNEDAEGVLHGIDYLNLLNYRQPVRTGKKVAIVGGGDVAIDASREAIRQGAAEVRILYRRSRSEMPAVKSEIEAAEEEGIQIELLVNPIAILTEDGKVSGVRCVRMELGEPDESGRRRPVPLAGSEFDIPCDMVIPAIGQQVNPRFLEGTEGIQMTRWGTVAADPVTYQTSFPGIFAGGDLYTGPSNAVEAVAAGQQAAISIEKYLQGEELAERRPGKPSGTNWKGIPENIVRAPRAKMPVLPVAQRIHNYNEVELGFTEEQAVAEASRCVVCGSCCECKLCVHQCKAGAIDHGMTDRKETLEVGSIIIATGFDPMDPSKMTQYGYGRYRNVFTNIEFERLSNATGPTSGKLLKRDLKDPLKFTSPPRSVAILHCVGSRDQNYHEYCSRTCCMYALKYAHLLKDKCGHDTEVYNFYIDMRCFGKGYEEFYKKVQAEGVRMIRGKAGSITEDANGILTVKGEDTLSNRLIEIKVEMVILCTAMEARPDAPDVMRKFGIGIGQDGFFQEQHPKLAPVSTPTSGVFLAGACQGPKDIPDTVAQAKGAAAECLALTSAGQVEIPPMISSIDPDICVGCQLCIGLCAYSAIEFSPGAGISVVNSAVCKGCGSCSGACPSGAAKVRHFTDKQIFAEIDGILLN
ncbi:MAG: FAD-dependent oxidoreductase [Syntrophobacteraceae bacterium]|jgi:heterodisulfide reductase subunit A|nr:FAD-dependent oxidoreductase [Syntrophobacteraceae bacterium]